MKPDKTSIDRLLALDDAALEKAVISIASAAGLDSNGIRAVTGNLEALREGITKMTDSEINAALSLLGNKRASAVLEKLKGENNG